MKIYYQVNIIKDRSTTESEGLVYPIVISRSLQYSCIGDAMDRYAETEITNGQAKELVETVEGNRERVVSVINTTY